MIQQRGRKRTDITSPNFLNATQRLAPTAVQATCYISSMSNSTYLSVVSVGASEKNIEPSPAIILE